MLLNEPTPRHTRPATAATASTRELPPVDLDGAPTPPRRSLAEADTVAFTAVDAGAVSKSAGAGASASASASNGAASSADDDGASSDGADVDSGDGGEASTSAGAESDDTAELSAESVPRSNTEAPTVGIEQVVLPPDGTETVALDVEAVKRAVAEGLAASDATATVSLDVAAVKRAMAEASASADDITADTEPDDIEPADAAPSAPEAAADLPDSTSDSSPDSTGPQAADTQFSSPEDPTGTSAATSTSTSTDLVPATESSADSSVDTPTAPYLVSTDLSASASTLVAVPETADDVIATIHAAATAVAAADRRARQAAVAKEDPWTGLDLHQPPTPAPVDNVLDLLAPVLERPLLVVEQPGLPAAADVVALHRSELEVDFVEPPVVAAGAEPPIPPRYGPGLSVLPHIEFPV